MRDRHLGTPRAIDRHDAISRDRGCGIVENGCSFSGVTAMTGVSRPTPNKSRILYCIPLETNTALGARPALAWPGGRARLVGWTVGSRGGAAR